MANRHALTLCNRRSCHNFTDFCNFVSKVWTSCQDAVRSDSFLPYQKLARSFCPPGNLQTQRNRLGHSKSFHLPRALVNWTVVMPMSIQAGSTNTWPYHVTGTPVLQWHMCDAGRTTSIYRLCCSHGRLHMNGDYTGAHGFRRASTVEFTSSSLCLPRAPGTWVSASERRRVTSCK